MNQKGIFKALIIIVGIVIFLALAVITYQTSKLKVTICNFEDTNICFDGESTADLNRVLSYKDNEVLKFTHCKINNSQGVCVGKSDKTNESKWKVKVTSKSNFSINSNYNN